MSVLEFIEFIEFVDFTVFVGLSKCYRMLEEKVGHKILLNKIGCVARIRKCYRSKEN